MNMVQGGAAENRSHEPRASTRELDERKDSAIACVRSIVSGSTAAKVKTFETAAQERTALPELPPAEGCMHFS
jgi:hypothetical protein